MANLTPSILTIETNASCQLRCPTCPTTSGGYPQIVGSGHLRFVDFRDLIESYSCFRTVRFENRGEMFLNQELPEILAYGNEKGLDMYSESGVNFNTVSDDMLESLVKFRLKRLLISIDGASAETYSMYRIGGDFNRVIEHILQLNEWKKIYRSEFPKLTWQFVVFGHNQHEIPAARQLAAKLNMRFQTKMSWDSHFSPITEVEFVKRETGWPAVTREEFELVSGNNYMRNTCFSLWRSPHINWDGKVLGCCWNSWMEFGGNAFKEGYRQVINGDAISYARVMLQGKIKDRSDIPCSQCRLFKTLQMTRRYLTPQEIFPFADKHPRLHRALYIAYHSIIKNKLRLPLT